MPDASGQPAPDAVWPPPPALPPTALLDTIVFGNDVSERAHAVTGPATAIGVGGLGQTFRRITPDINPITFHITVDPNRQNYLTLRFWGSDTGNIFFFSGATGVTDTYGGGDVPELDYVEGEPPFPGRFYYTTWAIPVTLTTGKVAIDFKIAAYANISPYQTDPALRLSALATPSRPLYTAYVHVDPFFVPPSSEPIGIAPVPVTRPPPTSNATFAQLKVSLDTYVEGLLNRQLFGPSWDAAVAAGTVPAEVMGICLASAATAATVRTAAQWRDFVAHGATTGNNVPMNILVLLAMTYQAPDSRFYQSAEFLNRVVAGLDGYVRLQGSAGQFVSDTWIGAPQPGATGGSPLEGFGVKGLARAFLLLQAEIGRTGVLEQQVDHDANPSTATETRRKAWTDMFAASRDFLLGPFGRGHAANQDQAETVAAYLANETVRVLDATRALPAATVAQDIYSAFGLAPAPIGGTWLSNKGLSLEPWGTLAGSYDGRYSYSPITLSALAVQATGDAKLRQRALDSVHALAYFMTPGLPQEPGDGLAIRREEVISTRNNHYPGETDVPYYFYAAGELKDPIAIRLLQISRGYNLMPQLVPLGDAHVVDTIDNLLSARPYFDVVTSLPATSARIPMDADAPDFAWADEQGSVVVIKNRGERVYLSLNWRRGFTNNTRDAAHARVNNVARVHATTTGIDRVATITNMQSPAGFGQFYIARYGHYLVGMNVSDTAAYALPIPAGAPATAPDLISRRLVDLRGAVMVPHGQTIVLELPDSGLLSP